MNRIPLMQRIEITTHGDLPLRRYIEKDGSETLGGVTVDHTNEFTASMRRAKWMVEHPEEAQRMVRGPSAWRALWQYLKEAW